MFGFSWAHGLTTVNVLAALSTIIAPAPAFAQETGSEWQKIVDAAKSEGGVTIYSAQGLKQLNDVGARFKAKYGIEVQVVRAVESDLFPKVDIEHETGKGIADILVTSSLPTLLVQEKKGYMVPVVGPSFDNPDYDRAKRMPNGTYFEISGAILTFSWNTDLYPKGIKDFGDIIDPALEGKIGIPMAKTTSQVNYYLNLTENYGADYLERLAKLKPRAYVGALPQGQAVASGEISVALSSEPLIDEKELGAPVDWGLPSHLVGSLFNGMVLKSAPHPNAAQLLADFLVTPEGQEAISRKAASALPNIAGAIMTTDKIQKQDMNKLTPEFVAAFGEKWKKLFAD